MANEEKLAKFHQAINHYAQEQRRKIEEEVADFKKRKRRTRFWWSPST